MALPLLSLLAAGGGSKPVVTVMDDRSEDCCSKLQQEKEGKMPNFGQLVIPESVLWMIPGEETILRMWNDTKLQTERLLSLTFTFQRRFSVRFVIF